MPDRGYTVRMGREGWGVYAQQTGEPVRVNGRVLTGLPLETATEFAESLQLLAVIGTDAVEQPIINPGQSMRISGVSSGEMIMSDDREVKEGGQTPPPPAGPPPLEDTPSPSLTPKPHSPEAADPPTRKS
ncbi:hypothetical protein [Methylobacterium nodulans]|uniref:Uncharacterized protein n=1 Tax=Methylobacterium nodulans (strain LMG 21967 / CNCM I-2342 / ORS 2060) TaxID=460265 RepID=B8IX78_METNO|nr:hypothetical protein Mnod_8136 [Methylobacterium nodulans ORS 2060]